MFKIIFLLLGLAIGFGGGVFWGQHNPEAAGKLSAEEERRFLETQLAVTQKIQAKLDQLGGKASKTTGSGFLPSDQTSAAADVNDVKAEAKKQEQELRQHLDALKK